MSDEANPQVAVLPPPPGPEPARPEVAEAPEVKENAGTNGTISAKTTEPKEGATDAPVEITEPENTNKQPTSNEATQDKPATTHEDIKMQDDIKPDDVEPAADESAEPTVDTPASAGKSKAPLRRKSGGIPEHKKKLNKKASKAKMTHTDAKPGDYFYVRLKGYPLWPAIVCDESMLPNTLIKSRPVTAARPDGSYRDDYEDGGPKVKDRTFPVMYLHTNEFGWIPNYDLVDLDFDNVADIQPKMRKDLAAAHTLAAEQHDLEYFKEVLKNFMEAREAERLAKEEAKAAKSQKAKKEKRKSQAAVPEEDGDVEMPDAPADVDSEDVAPATTKKNKRKAEEESNMSQPSDSSKKVKLNIKLNTPKATNGTSTPKSTKDGSSTKSSKPKTKKATPKVAATPEAIVPKEPELTAEEKRAKKEKEILFLRHKLQKGLLTRDQLPKEDEMKQMSEFVSKLEGYAELEVSIIRATKINKVLKAILKLSSIPKEEEFQFKPRSQTLLDKWNKLLASEQGTPSAPPHTTNGASEAKPEGDETKASPVESTNGVQDSVTEDKTEEKVEEKAPAVEPSVPEAKDALPVVESAPSVEDPRKESISEPTPVESTA